LATAFNVILDEKYDIAACFNETQEGFMTVSANQSITVSVKLTNENLDFENQVKVGGFPINCHSNGIGH